MMCTANSSRSLRGSPAALLSTVVLFLAELTSCSCALSSTQPRPSGKATLDPRSNGDLEEHEGYVCTSSLYCLADLGLLLLPMHTLTDCTPYAAASGMNCRSLRLLFNHCNSIRCQHPLSADSSCSDLQGTEPLRFEHQSYSTSS
jgi:hypothetical protein